MGKIYWSNRLVLFASARVLCLGCWWLLLCGSSTFAEDLPRFSSVFQAQVSESSKLLASKNLPDRLALLDQLVVPLENDFYAFRFQYDLPSQDYLVVLKSILKANPEELAEYSINWRKVCFPIVQHHLQGLAIPLAKHLAIDIPYSQLLILKTLQSLQAKETIPSIIPLLRSTDELTSWEAQKALVLFHAKEAIPFLGHQMQEGNSYTRLEALKGLMAIGDHAVIPHLLQGLEDPAERIQIEALKGLVSLNAKDQVPSIWEFLNQDVTTKAREHAVVALLIFEETRAIPLALDLWFSKSESLNTRFHDMLLESKPSILAPPLVDMLQNPQSSGDNGSESIFFLSNVVDLLVHMKAREAIPVLRLYAKNMNAKYHELQEKSVLGLGTLKAREAIPDLLLLLRIAVRPTIKDLEVLYPWLKKRPKPEKGKVMGMIPLPPMPYPPNPGAALALIQIRDRTAWPLILTLLEQHPNPQVIWELNSWTNSDLWDTIHKKTFQGYHYAPLGMITSLIQQDSGVPLQISDSVKKLMEIPEHWYGDLTKYWWPNRGTVIPVVQGLQEILRKINSTLRAHKDPYTVLAGKEGLQILRVSEAIEQLREDPAFFQPS